MTSRLDEWMSSEITRCQRFAGEIALAEYDDVRRQVHALTASIDTPPSRAHSLVLAPLLLDAAMHVVEHLHRRFPFDTSCPCRDVPRATIRAFTKWQAHSPADVFRRWSEDFFKMYERHHPETAADRVARLIREQPDRTWTLASLARLAAVSPHGLARRFRREYEMSVRAYQHLCRMHAMLARMSADTKIEALALEAGYRSRKDFYRVLRQTMQLTPALLRRLTPDERAKWQRHLHTRLRSTTA